MKLSEYIKVLQELESAHGDLPVAMTQAGYYSNGQFADLFDVPEVRVMADHYEEVVDGDWSKRKRTKYEQTYLVLGHSHQSH